MHRRSDFLTRQPLIMLSLIYLLNGFSGGSVGDGAYLQLSWRPKKEPLGRLLLSHDISCRLLLWRLCLGWGESAAEVRET
jgi:hypothetical protein